VEAELHSFLTQHLIEMDGRLHSPAALIPGKEPKIPIEKRLGAFQNRFGQDGERKTRKFTARAEDILTELPRPTVNLLTCRLRKTTLGSIKDG
jgi:hypothetical protein